MPAIHSQNLGLNLKLSRKFKELLLSTRSAAAGLDSATVS